MALTDELLSAMEETRRCHETIRSLVDSGRWNQGQKGFVLVLTASSSDSAAQLLEDWQSIRAVVVDGRLRAQWIAGTFDLIVQRSGDIIVQDVDEDWLLSVLDEAEHDQARSAVAGEVDAAASLAATWTAEIRVDLGNDLRRSDSARYWQVTEDAESLAHILATRPWWNIGELFNRDKPQIFVLMASSGLVALTKTTAIIGRDMSLPLMNDTLEKRGEIDSDTFTESLPSPDCVYPVGKRIHRSAELDAVLVRYSAALAWAKLASSTRIIDNIAQLEFSGFQQAIFALSATGPTEATDAACRRAVELWDWSSSGDSPDKKLAVRQVISIRHSGSLWSSAIDVRRAAEPVFLSLRSDATAEALKAVREARSAAFLVARQTSESTASLTKGAVERTLATLGGVLAIVIARSTSTITPDVANGLRDLGACFFFALAIWSAFFEGPTINLSIRSLKADIYKFSEFVTAVEAKEILELDAVTSASRRATLVRRAVPIVYILAGIGIFAIARF